MKKIFTSRGRLLSCPPKLKVLLSPALAIVVCVFMLMSATSVFAQGGKVKGTVVDEKGETLPGVSVTKGYELWHHHRCRWPVQH